MDQFLGIIIVGIACLVLLFSIGVVVLGIVDPCHPWAHAFRSGNYCSLCGEQLRTICECGQDVTGQDFCTDCGLAVSGG